MKKQLRLVSLALALIMLTGMSGLLIPSVSAAPAESDHYFYAQLEPAQKVLYDAMEAMLGSGAMAAGGSYLVTDASISSQVEGYANGDSALIYTYAAARDAFAADHPEVFWVNFDKFSFIVTKDNTGYELSLGAGREKTYYNVGFSSEKDVAAAQTKLNAKVSGILSGTDGMSTKEIITKVHNEIIQNCTYRLEIDCSEGNQDLVRTAYGALVKGEALCEGYSEAMKLVLDAADIPCVYVTGYVEIDGKPQLHAWNEVQVDGQWYAVDATYDDPLGPDSDQDNGGKDGYENTTYLLVGAETMNRTHQPDGIMSEANYEFEYPIMSDSGIKFEEIINNNGLVVEYSKNELTGGLDTGTFRVSFNGMGYAKAAEQGYWMLSRSYLYYEGYEDLYKMDWAYLSPNLYDALQDTNTYLSYSAAQIAYVEFAVTTTPKASTGQPSDEYFQGDPSTIIAESGLLHNENASYVAPPYPCKFVPSNTIILNAEQTYDVAITYDDTLVLQEGKALGVDVKKIDADGNPSEKQDGYTIENLAFDAETNTISFKFTPSQYFADDNVVYQFQFTGIVGEASNQAPKPASYGARFYSAVRCSSCARKYGWNVFAKPALLDIPEDISKWTLGSENGKSIPASLTDRMALVVSDATPSEAHAMEEAVASNAETSNDKILASESYNIDFTLCRQQVVTHGAKVSVKIGFPGSYDANSDVTYKVYHFIYDDAGNVTAVEEIPCVVTQYGLIAYCNSFSPYMVAAVANTAADEPSDEPVAPTKSIALNSSYGGSVTTSKGAAYATLKAGESVTLNIKASDGYQIASVSALGKSVSVTNTSAMEITVKYEDIVSNNIVEATFVATAVAEKLAEADVTLVEQPTEIQEPAEEPANPDTPDPVTPEDPSDKPTEPGTQEDPPTDPENPGTEGGGSGETPSTPSTPGTPSSGAPEPPADPGTQDPVPPEKPPVFETYSDIKEGAWYETAVQSMVDTGLMTGVSDTSWAPEKTMTRAEAACILTRIAGAEVSGATNAFDDVASNAWYAPYVSYCAAQGYMSGYNGHTFAPGKAITREEFVTILYRLEGAPDVQQTLSFEDAAKVSDWARDAMGWAVAQGILVGDNNGRLNPRNYISRCEAAAVLQRQLER